MDAVGTEPPGAARACFRLAEVRALSEEQDDTGDGTRWRLEFLLQSSSDPSLLVAATQVWAGAADRLIADPQEVLLASSAGPPASTRRSPSPCRPPAPTGST